VAQPDRILLLSRPCARKGSYPMHQSIGVGAAWLYPWSLLFCEAAHKSNASLMLVGQRAQRGFSGGACGPGKTEVAIPSSAARRQCLHGLRLLNAPPQSRQQAAQSDRGQRRVAGQWARVSGCELAAGIPVMCVITDGTRPRRLASRQKFRRFSGKACSSGGAGISDPRLLSCRCAANVMGRDNVAQLSARLPMGRAD
jgi:hypothetical protein